MVGFILKASAFAILFMSLNLQEAQAYLDPGTGSYIFQILIGFILGGLVTLKMFWHSIKTSVKDFFGSGSKAKVEEEAVADDQAGQSKP